MKYQAILYILTLFSLTAASQIVLNGGVKIKIDGGTSANNIFMVLDSPPPVPIVISGTTDGIIMEDEYNRVQFNLGTGNTAITVPYMSGLLEQIPLTVTTNTVGVGSGNIRFSAKAAAARATGFDNLSYKPSDVTNMGSLSGITNNSAKTIDRFWIIDANGYTTKPAVTLNFSYIDAELAANGGNTISEVNLRAQRFNSTINDWGGYYDFVPTGVINIATNNVSGVNVPAGDFFRSWTLNDKSQPLPIELLNFEAVCTNNDITLNWCTATEKNNNYFTIEQSINGVDFTAIAKVYGNGTTGQKHCYQFIANSISEVNYFRLSQTDNNGQFETFKIISIPSCDKSSDNILIANDGTRSVGVILNSMDNQALQLYVHNALGQIVDVKNMQVQKGYNNLLVDLNNVSIGIFYISVYNLNEKLVSKKIIVADIGY